MTYSKYTSPLTAWEFHGVYMNMIFYLAPPLCALHWVGCHVVAKRCIWGMKVYGKKPRKDQPFWKHTTGYTCNILFIKTCCSVLQLFLSTWLNWQFTNQPTSCSLLTSILCFPSVCVQLLGQRSFSDAAPSVRKSLPCKVEPSDRPIFSDLISSSYPVESVWAHVCLQKFVCVVPSLLEN